MILIYSLIFAIAVALVFTESIKKHYLVFYSWASLVAATTLFYEVSKLISNTRIEGFVKYMEKAIYEGSVSLAFFILIIFAEILKNKFLVIKKLLSIKVNLLVISSILILPHGIMFVIHFIKIYF